MLTQVVPRTVFNNLLVAILFGVLVPYIKGIEYLDLFLLLPYSFLSLFFVAPMVVDAVFASPQRGVPLAALFRAAGIGWFTGVCVLWMGIATVSWRMGRLVSPPMAVGLSLAVMSLFACIFVAALAAWTANRSVSAATAKGRLRIAFLLILVVFFALPRVLDQDTTAWMLQFLTPEGLVRATLILAPLEAIAAVALLIRRR
ncbi:MAG: hypothetical protein ACKV2U_20895 [Bryobacteraceae bacterium]